MYLHRLGKSSILCADSNMLAVWKVKTAYSELHCANESQLQNLMSINGWGEPTLLHVVVFPLPCRPTNMITFCFPLLGFHCLTPGSTSCSQVDKKMFTLLWLWFNVHYSKELGSLITFDPLTVTGRQTNSPCSFTRDGYKMYKVMKCTCKALVSQFTILSPSSLQFSLVPTKSFWKALLLKKKPQTNRTNKQKKTSKQTLNFRWCSILKLIKCLMLAKVIKRTPLQLDTFLPK